MKKNKTFQRMYNQRALYALLLLPVIYYIIFCYVPMYGLNIAFRKNIISYDWIGFVNFKKFLTDPYFIKTLLKNTLILNFYNLLFAFPAPIILALMFNELRNARFKRVIQSITYLPHFISTVVICGMVVTFLSNDGFINQMIASLGGTKIQFLMKAELFRPIYIISGIWQNIGWSSIIYLAAISGVDEEMYEAATIDGAGRFGKMFSITLPSIMPTISIMLIMAIGGMMTSATEKILLLYNGATYQTADVISTYVYRRGMQSADYGYASAVGMFQSVIGLIMLFYANKISGKVSENSLW